ncbi:uncharacterized protein LOC112556151 isoform X1 [Pomacea canaliculata]|uniref:uncharacterized protein LOC112556151 isoform X1 n=1 Tax=Pomacea canaliculata TaxID=400727 RepID=UPI000D72CAD9|nr:uncharacterized protein LOC112556151 isoform X1 [Pomacea canaliculata]
MTDTFKYRANLQIFLRQRPQVKSLSSQPLVLLLTTRCVVCNGTEQVHNYYYQQLPQHKRYSEACTLVTMPMKLTVVCCTLTLVYHMTLSTSAAVVPGSSDVKATSNITDSSSPSSLDIYAIPNRPKKECTDHGDCYCTTGVSFCYNGECFCVWTNKVLSTSDLNDTVIASFLDNNANQQPPRQ